MKTSDRNTISRRSFIGTVTLGGTALVVGSYMASCRKKKQEAEHVSILFNENVDKIPEGQALNPFIIIDKEEGVCIMAHKPEMGQGTFQSIPLIIAEELDIDPQEINIKLSGGDPKYGPQSVGGSASVRTMWEPMRKAGAAARQMLMLAAAKQWNIDIEDCRTDNGHVINSLNGEKLHYKDLAEGAAGIEVPQEPKLKEYKDFKYIGKSVKRKDIPLKVTGKAQYGIDIKTEGMVYASIERPPALGASIIDFDASETKSVPGVIDVVKIERKLLKHTYDGIAVIGNNAWTAFEGRKMLKVNWEYNSATRLSTPAFYDHLKKLSSREGVKDSLAGNFGNHISKAASTLESTYETPFQSHAPIETQNAVVDVRDDVCEIWAPTQVPGWARSLVAGFLNIPPESIIIHIPFIGGAFGRRLISDFIMEGCALSKRLNKPVKVLWRREDDLTQGPFRPGSLNVLKGGLTEDGKLLALAHKAVVPSIDFSLGFNNEQTAEPSGVLEPLKEPFYNIPHFQTNYVFVDIDPIPVSWWRSVYSSTNIFAHESFIDELAVKAGEDPLYFRMNLLEKDDDKKVLAKLAEMSGWNDNNTGKGVAINHCFHSTAGHVVEVAKNDEKIIIKKVWTVIDCGIAVNPVNVKAQVEGSIVMALTAAVKPSIVFENGEMIHNNFDKYRLAKMEDIPEIDIHIMQNEKSPTGAGEPALPPFAPALTNAIYQLTGKRIRKLPFDPDKV